MRVPIGALDLGSGTIKLSVFEPSGGGWTPLCLEEANTELRRGMGADGLLQPGPVTDTLAACANYLRQAHELGVARLPAYATSAVRKARNPEALLGPLKAMGIDVRVLGEEDEGRLNLLGAQRRNEEGRADGAPLQASRVLVIDPGGDSTECSADVDGGGWEAAVVASLPFGSVSLQEAHGSAADNAPIDWARLEAAQAEGKRAALAHPAFARFLDQGLAPAIRMNAPIQRALEDVNGRPRSPHGAGGLYTRAELRILTREMAAQDHAARAILIEGEPLGKVDRTCYGFVSWLGILEALGAEEFFVEPWGIKLGAVIALNEDAVPSRRATSDERKPSA